MSREKDKEKKGRGRRIDYSISYSLIDLLADMYNVYFMLNMVLKETGLKTFFPSSFL
jgi:hypothetical protein